MKQRYFNWKVGFKLEDFWIGAYWQIDSCTVTQNQVTLWICFIPCVYIRLNWLKLKKIDIMEK
jgi:hypothetical protein